MCIRISNAKTSAEVVYHQLKFIKMQEDDSVQSNMLRIRCGCLKLVSWKYMHRCLYCSVFFCVKCAEEHFGQTIEEYRAKNPIAEEAKTDVCQVKVSQYYPCGKTIPPDKGNTNLNSGCGEFNCEQCNAFLYGE